MIVVNLIKAHLREVVGAIVIIVLLWWAYSTVYNNGVQDTNKVWEARIELQQKVRDEQISSIESLSKVTLEQTLINNDKTRKELNAIYSKVKGKPTTVIVDGKCEPSEDFMRTYNEIIEKGNQK